MGSDIHFYVEKKVNNEWKYVRNRKNFEIYRNYILFSILANVRNYNNLSYISLPKGLPLDVTNKVKNESDRYEIDGHSHSYLSLKELLDFDSWSKKVELEGIVNFLEYKNYRKNGKPSSYCRDVLTDNFLSNNEMDKFLKKYEDCLITDTDFYTKIKWVQPYLDLCSRFYNVVIPELQKIRNSSEDVRIVFFFDT